MDEVVNRMAPANKSNSSQTATELALGVGDKIVVTYEVESVDLYIFRQVTEIRDDQRHIGSSMFNNISIEILMHLPHMQL